MGRHSSTAADSVSIQELMRRASAEEIGPRRAARMAERAEEHLAFVNLPQQVAPTAALVVRKEAAARTATHRAGGSLAAAFAPAAQNKAVAASAALFMAASGAVALSINYASTPNAAAAGNANPRFAQAASATLSRVTVTFDGKTKTIATNASTVGDALKDAGITVSGDDKVSTALSTKVKDGATIKITRVVTKVTTEQTVDKHATKEIQDPNLAKGQKVVQTPGKDGVTAQTFAIRYEDGKEVSKTLTFSAKSEQKVDEVVRVGTKDPVAAAPASPAPASATNAPAASAPVAAAPVVPAAPAAAPGSARAIAQGLLASYGWGQDQFACLDALWNRESGWRTNAANPSGAYGIPQALPGSKMASAGADWATNPATQIRWGLGYIQGRYGSPCGAWGHSQATGWY